MGISLNILFKFRLFFFDLLLGHYDFLLEIFIRLLFCLSLGLIEHSFLDDDPHNIFVVEVFLAKFESIKHFLPLRRHVFAVE
jgi:hypothetical protein